MRSCFITFRSVTFAQRGEGLLRRAGIPCALQRTPKWMEAQGCGYSLRMDRSDLGRSRELLHAAQVPYRKVYQRREDGTVEEMTV